MRRPFKAVWGDWLKWWSDDIGVRYWSWIATWLSGICGGAGITAIILSRLYGLTSLAHLGWWLLGIGFAMWIIVAVVVARFKRKRRAK